SKAEGRREPFRLEGREDAASELGSGMERLGKEPPVTLRLGRRDEGLRASVEAQDGGIDARGRRREGGAVEASHDLDLVESSPIRALQRRRPDGGLLLRECPLDDGGARHRPAEQPAQDRARARKWEVRDNCEWLRGNLPVKDVRLDDPNIAAE